MEETSLVTLPKQRQGLILVGGVRFCMLHYIAKKKKKKKNQKTQKGILEDILKKIARIIKNNVSLILSADETQYNHYTERK